MMPPMPMANNNMGMMTPPIPQPPMPMQQQITSTPQVSMESVVAQGDEAAQRQHLGNLIFAPISAINPTMAPRIVGLIVYTLSI